MIHLKSINELNTNDILVDVKEIILELDDMDFETEINVNGESIILYISKGKGFFYFTEDFKMTYLRIYNYLTDLGYKSALTMDGYSLYVDTHNEGWINEDGEQMVIMRKGNNLYEKWPQIPYLKLHFYKTNDKI